MSNSILSFLSEANNIANIKNLSLDALLQLSQEVRDFIVKVISKTGGHLASSLGVVELTIALLHTFDFESDKIIWDVGHQSYAYKILTGRYKNFETLRHYQGLSGFPNIFESKYDFFGTGHSSTSISSALGFAVARDLLHQNHKVVAVIGDGAMTGGLAFEGMNNSGHLKKDMLVILNDNNMFISDRVGAIGKYFTKILSGGFVRKTEKRIDFFVKKFNLPKSIIDKLIKRAKTIFTPGILFEELGFSYYGPVDGNNLQTLIEVLEKLKNLKGPILLHVITKKGKGYSYAEDAPAKFHGLGKFDSATGNLITSKHNVLTYTQSFGAALVKEAEKDDKIVAITAAMADGTGLEEFLQKFPDRFFDVGIAEAHAITFASGLAMRGFKPVCAIYSTFLQRAYDQIIHDMCLQNLPVILAIDRAGIVGEDGATHNGVFDLSYLRPIPNLVIMSPKDENELASMLKTALSLGKPCAIRYPRGVGVGIPVDVEPKILEIGKHELIYPDGDVAVLAIGNAVYPSKNAIDYLEKNENLKFKLVNLRFLKPLDEDFLRNLARNSKAIITVEENVLAGGLGSSIRELLFDEKTKIFSVGLPDEFIKHGSQDLIREIYNLSEQKLRVIFRQIFTNHN